jgi:hypothetical protein
MDCVIESGNIFLFGELGAPTSTQEKGMAEDERTKTRSPKNEWMNNAYLLEAAVEAVKNGHAHLRWSRAFNRGWNREVASREYKCACAWVRRESLRAEAEQYNALYPPAKPNDVPARYKNIPKNSPDTLAAITLAKAVAERRREAEEREKYVGRTPPKNTFEDALEEKLESIVDFAKGFPKQLLLYVFAIVPLCILFGTDYHHAGIFGIFMTIIFVAGVALALLRFLVVSCISIFTGKSLRKYWDK